MGKWKNVYNTTRSYNKKWEQQFTWLCYFNEKCYCRLCKSSLGSMRRSSFVSHEQTAKHRKNIISHTNTDTLTDIFPTSTVIPCQDVKDFVSDACHCTIQLKDGETKFIATVDKEPIPEPDKLTKGEQLVEGKTKVVYVSVENPNLVLVENKDRITAGDAARAHDLEGKAAISNATNAKVFQFLEESGIKTSWIRKHNDNEYVARKCYMIPIEWVTRRVATGSFIRRNVGVKEGYRFTPPKLETFFKDDANHDPQWSKEQLLEARLESEGFTIGKHEYDIMARTTITVFEVLERAWSSLDCALIDMKVEFGVDCETGEILLSDVIDSDSWRLWPSGDKRLMKDKQVYRNLKTVTDEDLSTVKRNFQWVADKLDRFSPKTTALVVVLMGSPSDKGHGEEIKSHCTNLGLPCELRITSAHKGTEETLDIVAEYEGLGIPIVFIAVAGRSNGLGPVVSGNTTFPVINCPPLKGDAVSRDIWSSLSLPSGIGCGTVLYPEAAAQLAAAIVAQSDHVVWSKLRVKQLTQWMTLKHEDRKINLEK